jgi:2-iminobutanoate/2-iminopropanoate deaminase
MRRVVQSARAPEPVGPYSQAIVAGGFVWVSGQIALDPRTGQLVEGSVAAETQQVLESLRAVLEAAGSGLEQVVRATIYLTDLDDYRTVNEVYATYFPVAPPARVCVEVAALPRGARVEIDAVATVS